MSQISIRPAGLQDSAFIRSVSERTWPSTYGHIISQEQIDFMLDWMYSDASLAEQFQKGCQFFIASIMRESHELKNGEFNNEVFEEIGFCSVSLEDANEHKLNKLYVLPKAHGTGAGKALLNKAIEVAKAAGSTSLFLQVNKLNTAYTFYLKHGFVKERDFKFDIGNGFFMDDYVMRLQL